MKGLLLLIGLIFVPLSLSAEENKEVQYATGLQFKVVPPSSTLVGRLFPHSWKIFAQGEIESGDSSKLKKIILSQNIPAGTTVYFDSPGGNVVESMELGNVLRNYLMDSSVANPVNNNAVCASACVLAYVGGTHRYLPSKALFAVHRFSSRNSEEISEDMQMLSARIAAYLQKMEISLEFLEVMSAIPSDKASPLSKDLLEKYNVVDNGSSPPEWNIRSDKTISYYITGTQATPDGKGSFSFGCIDGILFLHILYLPYIEPEIISLSANKHIFRIDDFSNDITNKISGKLEVKDHFLTAGYMLSTENIRHIQNANTLGISWQMINPDASSYDFAVKVNEEGKKLLGNLNCSIN